MLRNAGTGGERRRTFIIVPRVGLAVAAPALEGLQRIRAGRTFRRPEFLSATQASMMRYAVGGRDGNDADRQGDPRRVEQSAG